MPRGESILNKENEEKFQKFNQKRTRGESNGKSPETKKDMKGNKYEVRLEFSVLYFIGYQDVFLPMALLRVLIMRRTLILL